MNIWIASHECSGISEAGGVKNVAYSLCREFQLSGQNVTLFVPAFGCVSYDFLTEIKKDLYRTEIEVAGKPEKITYTVSKSSSSDFTVVLVNNSCYSEKEAVYTYTANEEKRNPDHKKGHGHQDVHLIDTLFAKAVARFAEFTEENSLPHIIHCQDASTALVPVFCKQEPKLKNARTVVTIHNAGPFYHHNFSDSKEAALFTGLPEESFASSLNEGKPEPFLMAFESGALLTTVSPEYAEEITDPEYTNETEGLSKIFSEKFIPVTGITNGIDIGLYDPENTALSALPYKFSPAKKDFEGKKKCRSWFFQKLSEAGKSVPDFLEGIRVFGGFESLSEKETVICYHGRLATQKGLALLAEIVPEVLEKRDEVKILVMGQGEKPLEEKFISLSEEYSGRFLFLNGYTKKAARLSLAVSDFILMPSFFEPCGLEDFIAQVYGTLPVAHATGGLNKIIDGKTGFLYEPNTRQTLLETVEKACSLKLKNPEIIEGMQKMAWDNISENYQWSSVVRDHYLPLFNELTGK